ncbi:MAG TPA: DUF4097 family beta strand repeat-containing protein [Mucilaginibacter sp.]|nr:DUF4097 family beta strand repeat-containing protein [Mucilaginibacter sp.]
MKTIKITSIWMIAMLLSTSLWAQNAAEKQQLEVPLSSPGKPFKLHVGLLNGSISVIGYEGKDILIEAQAEGDGKVKWKDHGDGMKRLIANSGMDIQARESNNDVNVSGNGNKSVKLVIKIPQNEVTMKLSTVNNGNITASNVSGDLEITNVNGSIKLTNISGSVVANTVNGPVVVTFKSIDPKAAMAFTTLNGNVDVTFPAGLKANVKLKSDRGDIFTDFDVATDQHKPTVSKTTQSGMYSLKIEDWVYGKIDGGGPELMMKNMNGNIYIRKVK